MTTQLDFSKSQPQDWLNDLPTFQRSAIETFLKGGLTEEEVAELWLSRIGSDQNIGFGAGTVASNYLASVKSEFRKFVCGDADYESLRLEAEKVWVGTKYPIVVLIAGVIGAKLGLAAAVISPVVALLLAAVCKIGKNAWCNMPPPVSPSITATREQ